MLPLHELQQTIARGILAEQVDPLAGIIREDGLPFDKRLQVYRNNTIISLTEALKATYPVVSALVGEQFFAFAAKSCIAAYPPRVPRLIEYGAEFADFLAGFAPAQSLPYLPDMARLEWAINEAYHAPDDSGVTPQSLSAVPQEQFAAVSFKLRSSGRLLHARYRVDRLWRAHQPGGSLEGLEIAGDCHLLIYRPAADVEMMMLDAAGFALLTRIAGGATLESAYEAATSKDPAFDLTAALGAHLTRGTFNGFSLPADS
jgi:Putative DNA-binding domain